MKFNEYKGLDLVSTGNEVLERWKKNHAFEKSLELREGAPEFIFFEGPPSANGMPGIHHVMARSIKDAICRFKTQSGYKVNRRAGWDTHGLPVELGVEKMLGIILYSDLSSDIILGDTQHLLDTKLHRKTMGVPSCTTVHLITALSLVTADGVLD